MGAPNQPGEFAVEHMIPASKVGLIIGMLHFKNILLHASFIGIPQLISVFEGLCLLE